MGEIADAMLDGTLCECCGSYIGDATGYPGYCSRQCAADRGALSERDDRPKLDWLRVHKPGHLNRIRDFVKRQAVNVYSGPRLDRKGSPIIMLGWDDKPDSDWGRFKGNTAAVWFASEELAKKGEAEVRKALGWSVEP